MKQFQLLEPWREGVVQILNQALAEELACVCLYARNARQLKAEDHWFLFHLFCEQMAEEASHARLLTGRIRDLGGEPTHQPADWWRMGKRRCKVGRIRRMLQEAAALEHRELARYEKGILSCSLVGDLKTKELLEGIVDSEQSHQDQWVGLLARWD